MYAFNSLIYVYDVGSEIASYLCEYEYNINDKCPKIKLDVVSFSRVGEVNLESYDVICSEVDLESECAEEVYYIGDKSVSDVFEIIREFMYGEVYMEYEPLGMYKFSGLNYEPVELSFESYLEYMYGNLKLYSLDSFQDLLVDLLRERLEYNNYDDYDEVVALYDKLKLDRLLNYEIQEIYDEYVSNTKN